MKTIEDHPDIESLFLANSKVTDAGLRSLRGKTRLQTLDLGGTQISDAGLTHLTSLGRITSLRLFDTKVTDAGLQHLQGMEALVYLDLAKTKITDAGLRTLAMQSHPQLAGIDLAGTLRQRCGDELSHPLRGFGGNLPPPRSS